VTFLTFFFFRNGTTDVTRTIHLGKPTAHQKRCFTRVLQGHINLDRLIFPSDRSGYSIDLIARSPLWEDGLDYRHGTGHGVGHFLNVHEGPQSISSRISSQEIVLKPGMIVSNGKGKQKKEAKMNDEKKRARRK
jgi:Xaa-Pro aminopeptidase